MGDLLDPSFEQGSVRKAAELSVGVGSLAAWRQIPGANADNSDSIRLIHFLPMAWAQGRRWLLAEGRTRDDLVELDVASELSLGGNFITQILLITTSAPSC